MIKAGGSNESGQMLVLGLSRENVTRLLDNQPIIITPAQMAEIGLPAMTVILLGGETEQDVAEDLRTLGWLRLS